MKEFIKDSIEYIKGFSPALWLTSASAFLWIAGIVFNNDSIKFNGLYMLVLASISEILDFRKSYLELRILRTERQNAEYNDIMETLAIVLAELHELKDSIKQNDTLLMPDSFWTKENIDKFNKWKP